MAETRAAPFNPLSRLNGLRLNQTGFLLIDVVFIDLCTAGTRYSFTRFSTSRATRERNRIVYHHQWRALSHPHPILALSERFLLNRINTTYVRTKVTEPPR